MNESAEMQELADGVAFWRTKRNWPADFQFKVVQDLWVATEDSARASLVTELTSLIESTRQQVVSEFPMTNKIVELRLIGQQHPGMGG